VQRAGSRRRARKLAASSAEAAGLDTDAGMADEVGMHQVDYALSSPCASRRRRSLPSHSCVHVCA